MIQSDALSRRPDYEEGEDKGEVAIILPESIFIATMEIPLKDWIQMAMEEDLFAIEAVEGLQKMNIPPLKTALTDWKIKDGLLFFKTRLYILLNALLRREIVSMHHDPPVMGHPGVFKTLELVRRNYWWPGLYSFIKRYVHECTDCQQMKVNTHPTTPPLNPIRSDPKALPFSTTSMDFITELPELKGYDALFVVVDRDLFKGIILIPYHKTMNAIETAELLHDNVY